MSTPIDYSENFRTHRVVPRVIPQSFSQNIDIKLMEEAVLIRGVENKLLELFSLGKLNGTVHTCVGQEFSAIAFAGQLSPGDIVFSNHRCHGHYIAFTKDFFGLLAELLGKKSGICGGVGGSQHLCGNNFFSNGIQGGIVPVAVGMALAAKLKKTQGIVTVFLGDGTLGEGIVYEAMNIASLWELPVLFVCEDNYYAQSTPQAVALAGEIRKRPEAFGIKTMHTSIWETQDLLNSSRESIERVRKTRKPLFHHVEVYRLNPHSKGDDDRSIQEIQKFKDIDPLNSFARTHPQQYKNIFEKVQNQISQALKKIEEDPQMPLLEYLGQFSQETRSEIFWQPVNSVDVRQVDLINRFFKNAMKADPSVIYMGEDVASPYGGAFKVARDLSEMFPTQVFTTPISEAAITGIANGLALSGFRPFLEIMFGDFLPLCLDQLINHAAKFHHMYNRQVDCPVVLRLPMGGGRGYGPTHSQTLDKLALGIPHVTTVALNSLIDPQEIYTTILRRENHPVMVIENKLDYGRKIAVKEIKNYLYERTSGDYPVVRIRPQRSSSTVTFVCYGGCVGTVLDSIEPVFLELDLKAEVIVVSKISPLDNAVILESVRRTKRLFVVEEGTLPGGWGSDVIAGVCETLKETITARRIGALPVPIPAVRSLEHLVLPHVQMIVEAVRKSF